MKPMVKIRFLGGGREVGRAAIMVDTGTKYVFDYGVQVQTGEIPIPPPPDTSCILLSHAHLDHSGGLPLLYATGFQGNVYMTRATQNLCDLLLTDSLKVQKLRGMDPGFSHEDIVTAIQSTKTVRLGQPVRVKNGVATFHDAGHVPGSASVLLEAGGKRILYTGDINFTDTALMRAAYKEFDDIDILICECTYSYKNHPDRNKLSEELRQRVRETVHRGGTALLPAFAVGRTQEMLLIVSPLGIPITMDGMGIKATRIAIQHPESIPSPKKLSGAFEKAKKIRRSQQRSAAVERPGIIITTSGMMHGGPVNYYMERLHARKECSLTLLGFQIEGMPGRVLLDTGRFVTDGMDIRPEMDIKFMDFSSHASRDDLIGFISRLSPERTLLFHGDYAEDFAKELRGRGLDVLAPANGDVVTA